MRAQLPVKRLVPVAVMTSLAAALASTGALAARRPARKRAPPPITRTSDALANGCFALRSVASGRFLTVVGTTGYAVDAGSVASAAPLYLKPTGLGTFLLYDTIGGLVSVGEGVTVSGGVIARAPAAGRASEWAVVAPQQRGAAFVLRSTLTGTELVVTPATGTLSAARETLANHVGWFEFVADTGCTPFPEAQVNATGRTFAGTNKDGTVFGFVDDHLPITGDMRGGGDVIYGEAFDRFGVPAALGQDAKVHGPDGSLDLTGNLLRNGSPLGTHDTHGWPTFTGWPVYNTQTHQQVYYVWLQRAWEAGERLVVAQTVDDEALCRIEPRHNPDCDETHSIEAQIHRLRALQDYVDAQSGGSGRGWFRLVYSPAQARQVIKAGKLAVIIGIESSDLFGCSVHLGKPQCTRADIDRGIRVYKRLGVRGMFVAHWVDNALSGAALEGGAKGVFINILNRFQTGRYFTTGPCPGVGQGVQVHTLSKSLLGALAGFFPAVRSLAARGMPTYPAGLHCNARGLTPLGRYLITQLIAQHMLIEVDHMSELARDEVLSIAAQAHYPLISSHNGTGGEWTASELAQLYRLGGFAAVTPDMASALATKILRMAHYQARPYYFGVGIGTDTNGFASLPGPRPDASVNPLRYPFRSYDGKVTFEREQTGTRVFDLNVDGVAHYGLLPDLLADMERARGGRQALALLFRSAEAYLETWQRAVSHR
ncbi:MAG TPA: hypothetical protein VMU39_06920 [Solirubrobacteraceae bacterium]|nr:hypothetical protein [Solirubrobacteraceae bacterium]